MCVVFLGPPGAGKGTQARLLRERFGLKQISTGDILRKNQAEGTNLGKQAEGYMQRGELVPDALVIAMIERELRHAASGFVMEGFPRTVGQAEALDAMLERRGTPLGSVILLSGDRQALIDRLSARWTNPRNGRTYNVLTEPPRVAGVDDEDGGPLVQRDDDRAETVAKRLEVYDEQTKPLIDYYRSTCRLSEIDGLASVVAVADRVADVIGAKANK